MGQLNLSLDATPENAAIICRILSELRGKELPSEEEAKRPDEQDGEQVPTKTDLRAIALKLSKAGKQDILKELFAKYKAEQLSGVVESDYPALMKDLVAANE